MWTLQSFLSTMYTVQHTVFSVQRTAYCLQHTVYSVQCTAYSVHCTVYSVQCTAYSVYAVTSSCTALYSVHGTRYKVQCTLWWSVLCVFVLILSVDFPASVDSTGHGVLCGWHHTPHVPASSTHHVPSQTRHFSPSLSPAPTPRVGWGGGTGGSSCQTWNGAWARPVWQWAGPRWGRLGYIQLLSGDSIGVCLAFCTVVNVAGG